MGLVDYVGRAPSRARVIAGDIPAWIANRPRNRYIAAVLLSAPPWVDRWELYALKHMAAALTRMTGELHVLDHIIPLNHPLVCGLTVPWNLRIVRWRVNASKGSKWNPDQLELFGMSKPVVIKFDREMLDRLENNPVHVGMNVLAMLQAKGVPVVGVLWPMGVTSGVLTSAYDDVFDEYTYEWRPA